MTITIGEKYRMNPPYSKTGKKGKITTVYRKADQDMKASITALFEHHDNGMDWYKTDDGWAREDWLEEIK